MINLSASQLSLSDTWAAKQVDHQGDDMEPA
jgi:hypothetical protein